MSVICFDIPRTFAVSHLPHSHLHRRSDHHICFTVIFAFDCIVFMRMTAAFSPNNHSIGFTPNILSWILAVVVPLLTLEQFIASVLIAPKHKSSTDRKSPDTAMLGLKLYLIGIGTTRGVHYCSSGENQQEHWEQQRRTHAEKIDR
jgi:hypothetical protein